MLRPVALGVTSQNGILQSFPWNPQILHRKMFVGNNATAGAFGWQPYRRLWADSAAIVASLTSQTPIGLPACYGANFTIFYIYPKHYFYVEESSEIWKQQQTIVTTLLPYT
jgi:hypothetical protein